MEFQPEPKIIKPFNEETFQRIKTHVTEVRKIFDWPGIDYHDKDAPKEDKFNRWHWHNLPMLREIHNDPAFIFMVSDLAGQKLQPSYVFLSMYGPEGICPLHKDRPQCQFTLDLAVNQDAEWPIYIEEKPYNLKEGEAVFYSGTGQAHYRKAMKEDSKATFSDLAFFHFVPANWQGQVS